VTLLIIGIVLLAALATYVYVVRERLGPTGAGFAALRIAAVGLLLVLIANAPWPGRAAGLPSTVLVDRSLSMGTPGGQWRAALDSARAIAGSDGTILGFGSGVGPIVDSLPESGDSRLAEALVVARAAGGPVHVVTDGEIADAGMLDSSALAGVSVAILPRDTVPGVALVHASMPTTVRRGDTVAVTVGLASWGAMTAESSLVDVMIDGRRVITHAVALPPAPARVTRNISVPSAGVAAGDRIVEVRHRTEGDLNPEDDVRTRIVTITVDPPIVLIADPAAWDARYLYETLVSVGGVPVQGFVRVTDERWVDMRSGQPVTMERVVRAGRTAALLVIVGSDAVMREEARRGPLWRWTDAVGGVQGDWYVSTAVPPSPMTEGLIRVAWDSLPPLTTLVTSAEGSGDAVLAARLGRRGAERAVLVATERDGIRSLETRAAGVHRWGLRGGAGDEALRTLLAAGIDWLLRSNRADAISPVTATPSVPRGTPVSFRWHGGEIRDSLSISVSTDSTTVDALLRFGPDGIARLRLPEGVHRWAAADIGAGGMVVVETYSDEFPPRPVWTPGPSVPGAGAGGPQGYLRDRWWIFLLVVVVLAAEWAWRQRRGLP
jgi:hypothetical protein